MDGKIIMKIYRNILHCIGLVWIALFVIAGDWNHGLQIGIVSAQEDWRKEFEDVCSKTQDAMVIPSDELKNLVNRCDKLKPRIEKLDESQRKVYLKRLQLCRDLYFFVMESRELKK
jgi:hypothetical protein